MIKIIKQLIKKKKKINFIYQGKKIIINQPKYYLAIAEYEKDFCVVVDGKQEALINK